MSDAPRPGVRELILASAGSGKTFRISSRIIGLLAAGEPPSSVFASTFTRKAAGEILDRVLLRIADGALSPAKATELAATALDGVAIPEGVEPDPDFWRGVLRDTVRELHRIDIGTLDSFFVRVVRGFANELGLVPGWTLADERATELLRADALARLFSSRDPAALVETLRAVQREEVRRSVHASVAKEIDAVLRVRHDLAPDGPEAPGFDAMARALGPVPEDLVDRCRALADAFDRAEAPLTKSGTPRKHWVDSLAAVAEGLRTRSWKALTGKGPGLKLIQADEDAADLEFASAPIEGDLRDLYESALELARLDLGRALAARGRALGRLAEIYDEAWTLGVRASGLLRFEDVTLLAAGHGAPPPADGAAADPVVARDDLFYRLGSPSRHVLLDEFQDTSLLQWSALVPVLDRLTGTDGTLSVVADPKQSIYGWRGAEPAVVSDAGSRYPLREDRLSRSWRSSPVVLDAVNRVFASIPTSSVFADDDGARTTASAWVSAFDPHTAAHQDRPGRVRLVVGPPLEGKSSRTSQPAFYRDAAARVRDLHDAHPTRSIGVLMRTNDNVARMIWELGRLGVPASEEGGTRLVDAAPVVSLLALLRLADHPGDTLARYHVARTPVGARLGFTDEEDEGGALRLSRLVRRRLMEDGYGPLLAEWAEAIRPDSDARESARTERLVELGYRFDRGLRGPALRVREFVKIAEKERAESPGADRVRVMTVHGSKGLEFDVVVLPELHAEMTRGARTGPIARRAGGTGPVTHVFPRMSKELVQLFGHVDELREGREQEAASALRDALGTLYVGMTRARSVLEMVIPAHADEKIDTRRTFATLLRERLGDRALDRTIEAGEVLFDSAAGREDEIEAALRAAAPEAPTRPERTSTAARPTLRTDGAPRRNLERTSPSAEEGSDAEGTNSVGVRFLLGLTDLHGGARDRGTLVHAWMEEVGWIEDGLPDEDRLREIARRETPRLPESEVSAWIERLRTTLSSGEVRDALSLAAATEAESTRAGRDSSASATLRVRVEVPFLVRRGDRLMEGIVDRLVLTEVDGRVVAAEILDYKTDVIAPGDVAALDERTLHYRPQIQAYREAVATLFGLDPDAIRGRLLFLEPGVAREVPPA